ncbi:allantoinase [Paenibacillus phyllosphaerae]|uniref:Allantoinase n=1 Tax=Paenibacillus phyllosphaerae TaxID=274593 RepID=A0A7W5ATT5_9BACL|nr:allantoinase AllB [Paenibacillus phyllosphaerae]MBB3108482.1 allantoinase [Paenibacillus phyllosphaerae]
MAEVERYDWIIRGGEVVTAAEVRKLDIGIRAGRIAALAETLPLELANHVLDAAGQLVLPGMIDMHVHLNEPNFGHWEGFATGSAALAAGGITAYADMPLNGNPPTVTRDAMKLKLALADGSSAVDYTIWGGLVPGNLDHLAELHEDGVIGFKAFMSNPGGEGEGRFREVDDATLFEGMKVIASLDSFVALHAESDEMTSRLHDEAAAEGRADAWAFIQARPVEAELEAVAKAIAMAEETGCKLHFVHISSADGVELIEEAKRRGTPVTVETCPHYLLLTDEDMVRLGPVAKCAPPLRGSDQVERLWAHLAEGRIDVVASDHSPSPFELKDMAGGRTFSQAWGGIAGAQSSLELMVGEALKRGIPLTRMAEVLSSGPAKRLSIYPRKGEIAVGFDADLAIIDPNASYTLREEDLLQRHKHSPYIGWEIPCRVEATLVRGQLVYSREAGLIQSGSGVMVRPAGAAVDA